MCQGHTQFAIDHAEVSGFVAWMMALCMPSAGMSGC